MDRQEFFKKLIRSLFIITAVAALSLALSRNTKGGCPDSKDCTHCQKLQVCELPEKPLTK
jgi:hypothetical protein